MHGTDQTWHVLIAEQTELTRAHNVTDNSIIKPQPNTSAVWAARLDWMIDLCNMSDATADGSRKTKHIHHLDLKRRIIR